MRTSRPLLEFAFRCVLFASPLLLVGGWMEIGLSRMENSYAAKRRQLESRASTLEVIVTGSSGVLGGVDPDRLGAPAYNLANGNQTLHYDIAILSRYLDHMPRLRLVILGETYWSLALDLRNTREAWRKHFYSVFWQVPSEDPDTNLVAIQRYSYTALYTPMTAARAALNGFQILGSRFLENGWNPPARPSPAEHALGMSTSWARLRVEGQASQMRESTQQRNLKALVALADRLRGRGVQLALVWIPVSREYTTAFGETVAEQRVAHQNLTARPNIGFFDYSADTRFMPDDFVNGDHLGPTGARKFSELLATEVIAPLLGRGTEARTELRGRP